MAKIEEAKLRELREKHAEGLLLAEGEVEVFCKRPTRGDYRRYKATRLDDRRQHMALEELFEGCIVYPELKDFAPIADRTPALPDIFGGKLVAACAGEDPSVKR